MTNTTPSRRARSVAFVSEGSRPAALWLIAAAALLLGGAALADNTPYAGQEGREIASLSAQDIDDLLAGRGWGFAKPAELNGYPGPAHILELADELELTGSQRREIQSVFDAMNMNARGWGRELVEAEAALDAIFADGTANYEEIVRLTRETERIRAELRINHLVAHLTVAPMLTRHQTMLYNRARGYGGDQAGHSGHGNH